MQLPGDRGFHAGHPGDIWKVPVGMGEAEMSDDMRSLFTKLRKHVKDPIALDCLCDRYLGDTPSYQLSLLSPMCDVLVAFGNEFRNSRLNAVLTRLGYKPRGLKMVEQLTSGLTDMLFERGYRTNIMTYQEHCLMGSTVNEKIMQDNPHTVGAILMSHMPVDEARRARKLEYIRSAHGVYWGFEGDRDMLLPEIDDQGRTKTDPVLIDLDRKIIAEKLIEGAPYRR
jgi:hypothetical protein